MNGHEVVLMEGQASTSPLCLLDHDVDIVACPALLPLQKKLSKKPKLMDDACPPRERDSWSEGAIYSLLDNFEKKYIFLNRGNLRTRDWAEVAQRVSFRNDGKRSRKTSEQCKNKIDNLKKQYKKEKAKKETIASMAKSWMYFSRMDEIFGASSPMMAGIPGGINAGNCSQRDCGDECNIGDACEVGSLTPPVDSPKVDSKDDSRLDLDDPCQSPLSKIPKLSGLSRYLEGGAYESSIGKDLKEGLLGFAEVMQKIETAKMQMQMDVERLRADMELQRTRMMLDTQLQIAKCLSRRKKRSHASESSSSQ